MKALRIDKFDDHHARRATRRIFLSVALLATTVLVSFRPVFAQLQSQQLRTTNVSWGCPTSGKSGSHSFDVGNSWAGASGSFTAGVKYRKVDCPTEPFSKKSARAYVTGDVTVKLLKQTTKAFELSGSAKVQNGVSEARLRVKLGPVTLINETASNITWSKDKSITLISVNVVISIYGIPVTIKGSVAATLEADLQLAGYPSSNTVLAAGDVKTSVKGTASASADVKIASAGVEAILKLLQATLRSDLVIFYSDPFGSVKICFMPAAIEIIAFVKIWKPCWPDVWNSCPFKYSKTLVDVSYPAYCKEFLYL